MRSMPLFVLFLSALTLTACSSAQKQRAEQREKLAASSGLYCDFINGDEHRDVDVEVNMSMARRCDAAKPFSMTSYKNSSEVSGILYCCATVRKEDSRDKDKKAATSLFTPGAAPAGKPADTEKKPDANGGILD
ncbi:MAG: hypothetical protein KF802_06405 [Bdellovibrionaceae bacterium]|nr:hypothetical protein [Pseudobdellovibrionaceae bacterium]MBX3032554.1 hypothetical protein [Pseudobdellovibrionaceae bacterium]